MLTESHFSRRGHTVLLAFAFSFRPLRPRPVPSSNVLARRADSCGNVAHREAKTAAAALESLSEPERSSFEVLLRTSSGRSAASPPLPSPPVLAPPRSTSDVLVFPCK